MPSFHPSCEHQVDVTLIADETPILFTNLDLLTSQSLAPQSPCYEW